MSDNTTEELKGFLAQHETVAKPTLLRVGDVVNGWRVTGFLARGGYAEVYRVERVDAIVSIASLRKDHSSSDAFETNASTVRVAALKILARDDVASRARFEQEIQLLKKHFASSLPYFYGAGVVGRSVPDRRNHDTTSCPLTHDCGGEGTCRPTGDNAMQPYFVTDLLEPIDLPREDAAVARYLLAVSTAVAALHHQGLVHRDIKPANVMRRANGEIVLIDLGLVKDTARSSRPETNVSIINGKPVAVGTPAYAAPEQILGGEVSTAVDIHALGKLADVCFESHPPHAWLPIIRRATSSIPEHRYRSVRDIARAIRHRHYPRRFAAAASFVAIVAIGIVVVFGRARTPAAPHLLAESAQWAALCSNGTTNVVDLKLVSDADNSRVFKKVRRPVEATFVRLHNVTNAFYEPLVLSPKREYFIEGPGILTADLRSSGEGTMVHLRNCFVVNRSPLPLGSAGIRYVFDRGVYLNFPLADEPDRATFTSCFENYDSAFDDIRFGGPETTRGLKRLHHEEQLDQLRRATQTFYKNLHFPRHIFAPSGKYVVEDMEDSIYEKYSINPHRIPTDAEVELAAYCFDVSLDEALAILGTRKLNTSSRLASGLTNAKMEASEGEKHV